MKRGREIMIFLVLILLIVPLISAGLFSDLWGKITGKVSSQTTNVSIGITGVQPAIVIWVSNMSTQNPIENISRTITINLTVYDADGISDINDSSVFATFNHTGEGIRQNMTCLEISGANTSTTQNYTCSIGMMYWDINGTWIVNVSANDLGNKTANYNSSTNFTYGLLKAMTISPVSLTWNSVSPNSTNQTSNNDPTQINNTGNYNGTITITGIDLSGETIPTERIWAGNFSVDIDTGGGACSGDGCLECDGTLLQNASAVTITGSVANRGNLSDGGGIGQEHLYYCIRMVPPILSSQTYSTEEGGSWTITYPA